jgi:hypothetical protein
MTITAKVHNHTITLPVDVNIPDGAEVQVTLPDSPSSLKQPQAASFFDSVRDLVGAAKGLPEDFAAEHDHYIHGSRKRAGR